MITDPTPINHALESRRIKRLLPTSAGSAALSSLAPEIRERSTFSARTDNPRYLSDIEFFLTDLTKGKLDPATVRLRLKQRLDYYGYDPASKGIIPGSLQDLSSDNRTNLIIEMQEKFAHGYAQFEADQDPALLDLWPCWEFVRHESRRKERTDWPQRFLAAGGQLYGGRMIARKDSPVWAALSVFGLPYPPFDYNSGMGLDDVERAEAEALGVITKRTVVKPQSRRLNDSVQASLPSFSNPDLQAEVLKAFGKDIIAAGETAWLLPAGNAAARSTAIAQQTAAGTGIMRQVIDSTEDAYNALYVPDIGPVDFRWGDDGKGVRHIIKRRDDYLKSKGDGPTGEQTALRMPEVIIKGKRIQQINDRVRIEYDGYIAVLVNRLDGKKVNRWILTGFDEDKKKGNR